MLCCLKGKRKTGDTAADDQKISFNAHKKNPFVIVYTKEVRIIDLIACFVK